MRFALGLDHPVTAVVSTTYVTVVTVVAGFAMLDPNEPRTGWLLVAAVLCLPAAVPGLVALYPVLGAMWNLTDADDGRATWAVTATYTLAFGLLAVTNVWMVRRLLRRRPTG